MISEVKDAELNECMLYLSLASKYQLLGVAEKVIEVIYQRSTTDVMQCKNYDIVSAAPLMLRHAQWLEEEVQRNTVRVENILSRANNLYTQVETAVNSRFDALNKAVCIDQKSYSCLNQSCDGRRSNSLFRLPYTFGNICNQCAHNSRKQFKEIFTSITNELPKVTPEETGLSWPSFSSEIKGQFTKLKSL